MIATQQKTYSFMYAAKKIQAETYPNWMTPMIGKMKKMLSKEGSLLTKMLAR
jgi:hypothetical protein